MPGSQWQHYLPEVYLRRFGVAGGEVWRYDRIDGALKLLPPRVIGAERDLYAQWDGRDLSQEIEKKWFSPLDSKYGPIVRKILRRELANAAERRHLANFVAYLRVRTPAAIRETELRLKQFDTEIGPLPKEWSCPPQPKLNSNDVFFVSKDRVDVVSRERSDAAVRNEALRLMITTGMQLAEALLSLDWVMLVAPRGRSFVVGDNPFAVVPQSSHEVDMGGIGPLSSGAVTFVPLDATICLRMGTVSLTRSGALDGAAVRAINECQVFNGERYLFGQSDALLKRLIGVGLGKGPNLAEVAFREATNPEDATLGLIHTFTKSKISPSHRNRLPLP
ncbi:MAG TPA: DUF4238 domain-containing protein [Bryobacteraceae bacterium]|nr:DUF4238 domain-containing protein [Bryobacteraceae bacterium]